MSWFKYDCKFCNDKYSIDNFGSHIFDEHFDDMIGKIMLKDERVHLMCVTVDDEDMFMCAACGFAVKTQVTFDKHLRSKGDAHRNKHLENMKKMKGSNFDGHLNYESEIDIGADESSEEEEPVRKRPRLSVAPVPVAAVVPQRLALPLADRFNHVYSEMLQIYNDIQKENRQLRITNEELTKKMNAEKKQREDAIKLLSIK